MSVDAPLKLLVTGATGMIGRNLLRWLQGHVAPTPLVTALGRNPVSSPGVENILTDFSLASLSGILPHRTFDIVIHLLAAGVHPGERDEALLTRINAGLPPQIVTLAAQCRAKAVVIAGSSAEYAEAGMTARLSEQSPLETQKIYGASKAKGGLAALQCGRDLAIPVAVARIFNVYGPGEAPHRLLPSLVAKLRQAQPVPLSPGTQLRDFIYVDDVCSGLWQLARALMQGKAGGAYNLCTGIGSSVADFARATAHAAQADPALLQFGALPMRPDDIAYLIGDPTLLQTATGWAANFSVAAGIAASLSKNP